MTLSPLTDGTRVRARRQNNYLVVEEDGGAIPQLAPRNANVISDKLKEQRRPLRDFGKTVESLDEYINSVQARRIFIPLMRRHDKDWAKVAVNDVTRRAMPGRNVIVILDTGSFLNAADALEFSRLGAIVDSGSLDSYLR